MRCGGVRLVDEDIGLILQMATCNRDPRRGDRAGAIAVAHAQRTLQQRLDARREVALVLIADEVRHRRSKCAT